MIVVDASAVVDLLLGTEPFAAAVVDHLSAHKGDVHAPHLLDAEVAQVLRRYVLRDEVTPARAGLALGRLADLGVERYPHGPFLHRAFTFRDNVTIYDGLYLALAEALRAPLITRDAALRSVPGCSAVVTIVGLSDPDR